jgi:hypothetical protein
VKKAIQLPLIIRDRRRRHWHWSPDIIIELYGPLLGCRALAIYYTLCCYADRDEKVRISIDKIVNATQMSESQVRRELKKMEEYGLISVVQRGKFHLPNEYTLLDPPEEITFVGRATSGTPKGKTESPQEGCQGDTRGVPQTPLLDVVVDEHISIEDQQQHISSKGVRGTPLDLLIEFGIAQDIAVDLARSASLDHIEGWIAYAKESQNRLKNPQGFVVDRLKKGAELPQRKDDRYRYIQGEYADFIKH